MLFNTISDLLACPNCKDALEQNISAGFAWSIGLMMMVPFAILLGWGIAIIRMARRPSSKAMGGLENPLAETLEFD